MEKSKEVFTPEVFQYSSNKQEVRSLLVENEPWLVAKDVCQILELEDVRRAVEPLDEDEKLTGKILHSGQNRKMWLINESGFYTLVMRSNKPEAKAFRKWVTAEVLPAIRKQGYYGAKQKAGEYLDARDVPYSNRELNGLPVRFIEIEGEVWFSVNDIHRAIGSRTDSTQSARKLNKKQELAKKIWVFGNTNASWFTNQLGLQLLVSGSRILNNRQLELNFGGQSNG